MPAVLAKGRNDMEVITADKYIKIVDDGGYDICITREQAQELREQLADAMNKIGVKA
jgi:hypothetical protein